MKKIIPKLIILIILVANILWGISIAKCEILTLLHGHEFKDNYMENTMIEYIDYLKVLNYSKTSSCVYYVSANKTGGDVITFSKKDGEWIFENWHTVWSSTGSASNIIWPYWWHIIYGGV